ncbi:SWIRM domain-containing protein [Spinellus fusiger]|nr:SWIRM domain-containing protein [Spinellus fusiger]
MAVKEEEEEEEDEEEEEEEIRHHCSKEEGLDHKRKMSESHSIKDTFMPSLSYDMSSSPSLPIPVMNASHQPSVRIRDIERERPQLGSRQRKNEFEPYSNGDITNISQYTETFIEYPKRPAKIMRLEDTYKMTEEGIDIHPLISSMPIDYTVLHSPQWFDIHSVHAIEKLGLPEFFSVPSEETEKEYKKYRDFMVHTYRAHPDYYLTVAACKAKLDADLVLLIRLHSFLELYGLINAQVDPRRRIVDPYVDSDPDAGIKLKSQRDYRNSQPVDMQHLRDLIYNASLTVDKKSGWDLAIQDGTNPDAKTIYACTTCQTDCSLIRYQCLKHKQVHVCIDCFLEGRFTSVLSSGDFLRVESGSDRYTMEEEWGSMETLRLLEAVERYDDDWLMISEHVGSRSKEQCITHFLQLPISDAFLTAQLENKELEELPFGSQPNPVMTMIAFLSGHINPGVGAAAAKAAIKELLQSKEGQQDTSMHMEEEEDEEMEEMEEEEMEEEEMESHGQEEKDIKEEEIDIEVDPSHRLEDMDTSQDTSQENPSLPKEAFLPDTLKKATLAALWSAVDQAKKLASYEDQEIHHWTRLAVKTLVDKLLLKVQQYSELETSLDSEYKELKKQGLVLTSSIEALVRQYTPHPIAPPMALPTHTLGGESTSQPITIQTSTETPAEAAP